MGSATGGMKKIRRTLITSASVLALGVLITEAQTAKVLERVQVVGGSATSCSAIFISFNSPLKYVSHTFSSDGNSIFVRLIGDGSQRTSADRPELIETYPTLSIPGQGPVGVTMGPSGAASILVLQFSQNVSPLISQAGDSSIVISDIAPAGSIFCGEAEPGMVAGVGDDTGDTFTSIADDIPLPSASVPDSISADIESRYSQARAAITDKNYQRAIQLFTALAALPTHARSEDARELLGVARERNGQFAHAQAEYEIYLEAYPEGAGATRVRQRLAGLLTAQSTPRGQLRDASPGFAGLPAAPDVPGVPSAAPRQSGAVRPPRSSGPEDEEPPFIASLSSYYYLNQGSTVLDEFSTGTTTQDDEVFQNSLVTSFDASDSFENDDYKLSWRVAGDHEIDFASGSAQSISLSRAYGEVEFKEPGFSLKLGRQTKNNGGVFGRFDGALIEWPRGDQFTVSAVVGQPVDSSSDDLLSSEKLFFGVSVDVVDLWSNVDATAYFIQQNAGSFLDRRAIGFEVQYLDDSTAIFGMLDYDLHFGRINTVRATGTKIFADRSSATLSADFTHSPLLTVSNALQGQTATTLSALSATYTLGEIDQLASDRTTTTASVTAAYSRPLNDDWQFSVDGSLFKTSGSPASGGVAAVPATGVEFYTSAQVVGTGIFADRDVVSFSVRYANTASSELILLDTYRRFDFSDDLRLKPRLKVGYRNISSTGGTELFAIPSMTATYSLENGLEFEAELGARFSSLDTPAFAEETNEFFVVAGFRKDF